MLKIEEMAEKKYIFTLGERKITPNSGSKAKNVHWLIRNGFRSPPGVVISWDAHDAYHHADGKITSKLRKELKSYIRTETKYAVRSSANVEDTSDNSFAGQFKTLLNVQEVDGVLKSCEKIWKSVLNSHSQNYQLSTTIDTQEVKMAILVQEMVEPVLSGVAFSKNPINSLDEIIIEAVRGLGTALVQDGITPLRWVNKWGNWIVKPEEEDGFLNVIEQVLQGTRKIARTLKTDVDVEWVFDGANLFWLQVREITTIHTGSIYSNKIAKEMAPGLVRPLIWSTKIPNPAKAWMRIFHELIGGNNIRHDDLVKSFHYRAYFNIGIFGEVFETVGLPRESLEMMMGIVPPGAGKPPFKPGPRFLLLLPRLIRFIIDKWNFSRKFDSEYPKLYAESRRFPLVDLENFSPGELIEQIDQLTEVNLETSYLTIITMLLMNIYNNSLKSRLKKLGWDNGEIDLTADMPEFREYDLNFHLERLYLSCKQLSSDELDIFLRGDYDAFMELHGIEEIKKLVVDFLESFGHLSDASGHFDKQPWRETPGMILKIIAQFTPPSNDSSSRIRFTHLPPRLQRDFLVRLLYRRARAFRLNREKISDLYTYTLMLFRDYYLALGNYLFLANLIRSREDIFYLYDDEVRDWVNGTTSGGEFSDKIHDRKKEMDANRNAILPEVIFGDAIPMPTPITKDKLTGTPTSRGYYTGKVRVIKKVSEFDKLQAGDVLVIPYSDVSWTPLFTRAGGLIAESGGMLSHSSIIAREYGIPAVVSVNGATQLQDELIVTIDGYKGEVLIHESEAVT